jgi:hypothetical protein
MDSEKIDVYFRSISQFFNKAVLIYRYKIID